VAERTSRDQTGYQSVVDVPDHLWDAAAKAWRAATDRQFQMDMQRAELARQAAREAARPVVEGARRAGQVVSALFRDQPGATKPEVGPVDQRKIDERVRQTQVDIQRNLDAARAWGQPGAISGAWPAAAGAWVGRVREGGEWDDKKRDKTLERQGNYSYGATAAALGLPEDVALFGAGVVQRGTNVLNALRGEPLKRSIGFMHRPYGDDPRDQAPISEGYDEVMRGGSRRSR